MEIRELKIYSSNIDEQEQFYKNILGFKCSRVNSNTLEIQSGDTKLILEKSKKIFFYHFAFLIPTGTLDSAINFLEQRSIDLLPLNENKIILFNSGRAIYFYDRDGNIAEFIERPLLTYPTGNKFSIKSIIKLNEIGLPVADPQNMTQTLTGKFNILPGIDSPYSERFCWVGDHNGAIIVIKEGRNWLPTQKPGIRNDFTIRYSDQGIDHNLKFEDNKIKMES